MYLERTIKPFIEKISNEFSVLLLCGMRQIGKSYLLNHIKEEGRRLVSLDDLTIRELAIRDPKLFIQKYPPPVIIDEVQYAPNLLSYIKIYVDEHPNQSGLFWLTGSQQFKLMKGIRESLAGRVAIINMLGFSYRELKEMPFSSVPFLPLAKTTGDFKALEPIDLFTHIWEGSFPRKRTMNMDRSTFFEGYLQTYIMRDVLDDLSIKNELTYYDFIRAVAARTGTLLNYESIASEVGITVKTVKKWLETLVRLGIVYILKPYSLGMKGRIIKTSKIYFLDTGLASYLTKWSTPESLMAGAMSGSILETYVLSEILKSYWHNGKAESIYFYRDRNQKEIDFIIESDMILYPIEVKKTASPNAKNIKSFLLSNESKYKIGLSAIICLYPERIALNKNVVAVPVWEI